ncbi:pilus assembly protein TadG-related protein [Arthrobacter sp. ok362]|uniref:pilus assembly protein TadG-related protein n=1 Tax=Arthrobacter sp. ok362 TaxID=1761745 RepID=UPI00088B4E0D|nr:pilus assembly protein TadG-related protein [Arthrobacter sp. ok362]SDL51285.1 Flp pilus assembly protein TadG [Arthrobacter sp. ok362]
MRRLSRDDDRERGATGVLLAVMMLVLIGAGAMAVDVGQIYAERAQLQNAADAGALAVAQQCHRTPATCSQANALLWAKDLSGGNSNDGVTNVDSVDLSVTGQVTVTTSTQSGSNTFLTKLFASALNAPSVTVGAHATASMAPPTGGSSFPLAISDSCYNLSTASSTSQVQKISYKPGGTCTGPSGTQIPGGWGWLDQDSPCVAKTKLGSNDLGSDPGNNPPSGCSDVLKDWIKTITAGGEVHVAFPIFDDATNNGQNGSFHIIGYATFKVWGWKFGNNHEYEFGNTKNDPGMTADLACASGNDRCIIGQFIKFETIDSWTGAGGTGANLGTVDIKLIK